METTVFDANTFMNAQFSDANDTRYVPVPEGEFAASVKETKVRTTDKGYVILDITWAIDDRGVAEATGVDNPTVRQSIFLDTTPQGGLAFGPGKNVQLGKLRDALGQNRPGMPWGFGQLVGGVAVVKVRHRIVDDETFADVRGVRAL